MENSARKEIGFQRNEDAPLFNFYLWLPGTRPAWQNFKFRYRLWCGSVSEPGENLRFCVEDLRIFLSFFLIFVLVNTTGSISGLTMAFKVLRILLTSVVLITAVVNVWFVAENWSMENTPPWELEVEDRGNRKMNETDSDTSFVEGA